jgi:dienelactone hydrolase
MFRRVLSATAAGFDRAFGAAVIHRSRRGRVRAGAESLGPAERLAWLERIAALYGDPRFLADPGAFFPTAAPADVRSHGVRAFGRDGAVVDLAWSSGVQPYCADVAEHYLACEPNRTAAARLITHGDRGRPAVILVHGYLGGRWSFEERAWPLAWMHARGLDAALIALPFHGVRADPSRAFPLFPGSDPRITVEGFRQAVTDVRTLAALLRERGASAVGVMGMSLGGYTTALAATIEPELAFAVPVIPLASLADFARDGGRFVGTDEEQRAQYAGLDAALRVVSPFARPSRLARDRVLVLAGEGDQITPIAHAERLAAHFDAPLEAFHGGHLLQFGRGRAFRAVGRMLGRLGLLAPRKTQ